MKKDEIMLKSFAVFQSLGIKSTTQDMLSDQLMISKKTLYKNFSCRDDLLTQIISGILTDLKLDIEKIVRRKNNPLIKIAKICDACMSVNIKFSLPFRRDLKKYYVGINKEFEAFKNSLITLHLYKLLNEAKKNGYLREGLNPDVICEIHSFRMQEVFANTSSLTRENYDEVFNTLIIKNLRLLLKNKYADVFNNYKRTIFMPS